MSGKLSGICAEPPQPWLHCVHISLLGTYEETDSDNLGNPPTIGIMEPLLFAIVPIIEELIEIPMY
jgi:hypothetical protein